MCLKSLGKLIAFSLQRTAYSLQERAGFWPAFILRCHGVKAVATELHGIRILVLPNTSNILAAAVNYFSLN